MNYWLIFFAYLIGWIVGLYTDLEGLKNKLGITKKEKNLGGRKDVFGKR